MVRLLLITLCVLGMRPALGQTSLLYSALFHVLNGVEESKDSANDLPRIQPNYYFPQVVHISNLSAEGGFGTGVLIEGCLLTTSHTLANSTVLAGSKGDQPLSQIFPSPSTSRSFGNSKDPSIDFAVVKLDTPPPANQPVFSRDILATKPMPLGALATIAGYGANQTLRGDTGIPLDDGMWTRRHGTVRFTGYSRAYDELGTRPKDAPITGKAKHPIMIVSKGPKNQVGTAGDSGGPLFYENRLHGIHIFRTGFQDQNQPAFMPNYIFADQTDGGYYVSIIHVRDKIIQALDELGCRDNNSKSLHQRVSDELFQNLKGLRWQRGWKRLSPKVKRSLSESLRRLYSLSPDKPTNLVPKGYGATGDFLIQVFEGEHFVDTYSVAR